MLSPAKVLGNILFVVWLFAAFWWHHLVSALLSMTVDVSVFVYTQSCDISCNAFLCRSLLLVMQMPMKKESHLIQLAAVVHRWVLFFISEGRGGEGRVGHEWVEVYSRQAGGKREIWLEWGEFYNRHRQSCIIRNCIVTIEVIDMMGLGRVSCEFYTLGMGFVHWQCRFIPWSGRGGWLCKPVGGDTGAWHQGQRSEILL